MLERLLHGTGTLLRRRGRRMLLASAFMLSAGVVVLLTMPTVYTARSVVGPAEGTTYPGPLELLVERVRSPATLADVASDCELDGPRTPLEILAGVEADPVRRLAARVEAAGAAAIVVEASGTSRQAALRVADRLAMRLVELDAERRGGAPRADGAQVATAAAPQVPAQVLLAQLRLQHPLLRDADAERRLQELASRLSEDRIAVAAMRAQLDGLGVESERLEALVREEAARAWRLDRAERQALAERARAQQAPEQAPPRAARGTSPAAGPTPSRLAQLEAELQHALATHTPLHPDVRRLQRLLEAERQRVAAQAAEAPAPAPDARPVRSTRYEDVSLPADARVMAVTDDDDGAAPPAPPAEGPEAWVQRAPSYPAWVEARARAEEVRLQLDAREQERAARHREHDLLSRRLAELQGPRLEEARLLARVEEEARGRDAALAAVPSRPAPAPDGPPLLVLQRAGVQSERSPWRHLPAWALCSVLLPLLGGMLLEVRDRSVRGPEDLEGLGAPLLGVVPHLRRGR